MKKIEKIEKAIAEQVNNIEEYGINHTLFRAYRDSQRVENELIDFNDVIWDHEIEAIANFLKENEIHEFTISSTFSSLIKSLAEFDRLGFKISGVCEVFAPYRDWNSDGFAKVPAVRLTNA